MKLPHTKRMTAALGLTALVGCGTERPGATDPFARAVGLQTAGDFAGAVPLYDEVLRSDARHVGALFNRGACQLELGDTSSALRDIDAVLAIKPLATDALILRADARARRGEVDDALAELDAVNRIDPDEHEAYALKASILDSLGETEAAEAERSLGAVSRWIQGQPDDVEARTRRGLAFLLVGESGLAEWDLSRAVDAGGDEADRLLALAQARVQNGASKEALEALSLVARDEAAGAETSAEARLERASLYVAIGAHEEAIEDLEEVRASHAAEVGLQRARASARLAQIRATCAQREYRDANEALTLAVEGLERFDAWATASVDDDLGRRPAGRWVFLETLALALAGNARFAEAAKAQAAALEVAPSSEVDRLHELQILYEDASNER